MPLPCYQKRFPPWCCSDSPARWCKMETGSPLATASVRRAPRRMTVQQALTRASPPVARRDAETLLLHLLGRDRAWLLAHPEAVLSPAHLLAFEKLLARRAAHEPLQYLTGQQEFFGLTLKVSSAVLIPRPETELLVEAVLLWAQAQPHAPLHLVDVGTGSGAIALALATHLPSASITAVDLSEAALSIARENAERHGLATRVRFVHSDLLDALLPEVHSGLSLETRLRLDAVIANPPYIPAPDAPDLQPEVRDFEPHMALFAGEDGLGIYRRLIPAAAAALRAGGLLAMEFGFGQRDALAALLDGWDEVHFLDDLAGIPRVVLATRPAIGP